MWAALLALSLVSGASLGSVPSLEEGARLYDAADYSGSLSALTRALRETNSGKDHARIHIYIGLIQLKYGLAEDARASFGLAVERDPKAQLPKGASRGALRLFRLASAALDPPVSRPDPAKDPRARPQAAPRDPSPIPAEGARTSSTVVAASKDRADHDRAGRLDATPGNAELTAPPPIEESPQGSTTASWISIGIGATATLTGVVLIALAQHNASRAPDAELAKDARRRYETALDQRGVAFALFGMSGLAFGVAAFLTFSE